MTINHKRFMCHFIMRIKKNDYHHFTWAQQRKGPAGTSLWGLEDGPCCKGGLCSSRKHSLESLNLEKWFVLKIHRFKLTWSVEQLGRQAGLGSMGVWECWFKIVECGGGDGGDCRVVILKKYCDMQFCSLHFLPIMNLDNEVKQSAIFPQPTSLPAIFA